MKPEEGQIWKCNNTGYLVVIMIINSMQSPRAHQCTFVGIKDISGFFSEMREGDLREKYTYVKNSKLYFPKKAIKKFFTVTLRNWWFSL